MPDETPLIGRRFRRQRRRRLGIGRRYHYRFRMNGQLYKSLQAAADAKHRTIGSIIEEAACVWLGRLMARDKNELIQRLKYVDALITEVISLAMAVETGGQVKIAGQVSVNVHAKEARQERRGQKVHTATNQVFDLAQTEALAEENQMRAMVYGILSQLAAVDALVLRDAAQQSLARKLTSLAA